jgi:hypothetical protein
VLPPSALAVVKSVARRRPDTFALLERGLGCGEGSDGAGEAGSIESELLEGMRIGRVGTGDVASSLPYDPPGIKLLDVVRAKPFLADIDDVEGFLSWPS